MPLGRPFDEELQGLYRQVLHMAAMAEEAIGEAIEALQDGDPARAQRVIDGDARIDRMEVTIDEACIDLIARHQPVARDLRFLAAAMKINNDLERIADLAVNIAERALELQGRPPVKPLVDIPALAMAARRMVRETIDAFVERDAARARTVMREDEDADALRSKVQHELIHGVMARDGSTAPRAVPLLLVARHLERICDHATNIAEDVVYLVEGRMVKHGQAAPPAEDRGRERPDDAR